MIDLPSSERTRTWPRIALAERSLPQQQQRARSELEQGNPQAQMLAGASDGEACVSRRLDCISLGRVGLDQKQNIDWLATKVSYIWTIISMPVKIFTSVSLARECNPWQCQALSINQNLKEAPRFDSKIKEENLEEKFPDWGISAPASLAGFSSLPSRAAATSW